MIDVQKYLEQIPLLLEYFIPGFIFIVVFTYLTSRKKSSNLVIGSIVISYIIKAACSILHNYILTNKSFEWGARCFILCGVSLILSLLFTFISERKIINKIIMKINNKSIHDDIWHDTIDYKNGTTLRMHSKDTIYTGALSGHEEKGSESWFILDNYIIEKDGSKLNIKDSPFKTNLAINLKSIDRIELFYGNKKPNILTKIIEWFKSLKDKKNKAKQKATSK